MKLPQLFAKAAPDPLDANTTPGTHGTRSLNNIPLILIALVIIGFLSVVGLVMMQRSEERVQQEQEQTQNKGASASKQAGEVTEQWGKAGLIAPGTSDKTAEEPETPPAESLTLPVPSHPSTPDVPPPTVIPASPEETALWNARLQALQAGLRARTGIQLPEQHSTAANRQQQRSTGSVTNDVTSAYQTRLSRLTADGGSGSSDFPTSGQGRDNSLGQFSRDNHWALPREVEAPASPYELRAGFVIPAIMISGISSDLPGQVIAQVSQSVFDTATGRHLLIPQGTRLIGTYNSNVAYGQKRILMAWQRLIFPDGKALDIEAMPGADSAGYGGFHDQVNNHYLRIFGSSLLLSGVVAAVALSQDQGSSDSDSDRRRASDALSEALGQTMGSTLSEMLRKNLNISPTLEIRPGYRFNVMVVKDIRFKEAYRHFDY